MLEAVRNPVAYFFAMIAVMSVASLPPSPPTLMAAKSNPAWLLALLAAVAAAIAALFDHWFVRRVFSLEHLARVRQHRLFDRAERWAKVAPFFTVVLFAAVPLPFMIPRVLMPLTGYPRLRYAGAVALGRFPRVYVLAAFGHVVDVPTWILEICFVGAIALGLLSALLRRLGWLGGGAPPAPPEPPEG